MGKRDLASLGIVASAVQDGPRSRRKTEHISSDVDVEMDDVGAGTSNAENVREQGIKLWQTVKDYTKDGRLLTTQFLKQPPRRIYPDYYQLIQNPIALEDIKKKLDSRVYASLEDVRKDLDLCFTNAKQYNRKDSEIYQDAKELLKATSKAYHKLLPPEDGEERHKPPSLHRLMKSRLQKLVEMTDDDGRTLSYEFMELPSRKDWPIYYVQIKRPECLSSISKRVKKKEYTSSAQFAEDVELVFANAMDFNLEHTIIWEDAKALRDNFRTLMADMPPPHDLPQYSKPINKIKIKMPGAASSTPAVPPAVSTSIRLPAVKPPEKAEKPKPPPAPIPEPTLPVAPNTVVKVPKEPPAPPPKHAAPAPAPVQVATPVTVPPIQPIIQTPQTFQKPAPKPPQTRQAPPPAPPKTITPAPAPFLQLRPSPTPVPVVSTPAAVSKPAPPQKVEPPAPVIPTATKASSPAPAHHHRLKHVKLRTEPRGRWISLDHRDGVSYWSMRLERTDERLYFHEVTFFEEDDEEEHSGAEDDGGGVGVTAAAAEEEGGGDHMDADVSPPTKSPKKKKRGRGRPPKSTRPTTTTKKAEETSTTQKGKPARGETQVKINGIPVNEVQREGRLGKWTVDLIVGPNILEVGEKGGVTWRIYAERIGV